MLLLFLISFILCFWFPLVLFHLSLRLFLPSPFRLSHTGGTIVLNPTHERGNRKFVWKKANIVYWEVDNWYVNCFTDTYYALLIRDKYVNCFTDTSLILLCYFNGDLLPCFTDTLQICYFTDALLLYWQSLICFADTILLMLHKFSFPTLIMLTFLLTVIMLTKIVFAFCCFLYNSTVFLWCFTYLCFLFYSNWCFLYSSFSNCQTYNWY